MNYFELKIKVKLKKDIGLEEAAYKIGTFISNSMLKNSVLKELHEKKVYKYVYDTFYPIESDKLYKKGKEYSFRLRSMNLQILSKIAMVIHNHEYADIKALDVDINMVKVKPIKELYTLKPVITTESNGKPWINGKNSIESLMSRLNNNLEKKLNQCYGTE